ncbi:MAG: leucine-rich repeat domain-containing protein [Clostridia bacterium]|nr:leucine-rich repeat domain-containing protein [Clostridia bacterium]
MDKKNALSVISLLLVTSVTSCSHGDPNMTTIASTYEVLIPTISESLILPEVSEETSSNTEETSDSNAPDTSETDLYSDDNSFFIEAMQKYYEYNFMFNDELTWSYDEGSKTLKISGNGPMREYSSTIPGWLRSYSETIEVVEIEEGVTSVGSFAFCELTNLRTVKLPSSCECICDSAFENCNYLSQINFDSGLKYIGKDSFKDCSIQNSYLMFSEGMEYIAEGAFNGGLEGIKTIGIPSTVYYIGSNAFGNAQIQSITVSEDNKYYCVLDNVLYSKSMTTLLLVSNYRDYGDFVIPEEVTHIVSGAFNLTSGMKTITFPLGITEIEEEAFAFTSNIEEFIMPEENEHFFVENGLLCSVDTKTTLAYVSAFYKTSLVIPDGIERIGSRTFTNNDELYAVYLPDSLISIGEKAFFYTGLSSLSLPSSILSIEGYSFYGASFEEITYSGTPEEWEQIDIASEGNDVINCARIVYQ